jgi:LCP family protein required for cell wall assembly
VTRNERAARRARHGTRVGSHTALRWVAAATAGVVGFGIVFGTTIWENTQHSFDTQDISGLVGLPSHTAEASASASASVSADPTDLEAGKSINILLIGSDTRSGDNADIGGYVGGMRSDTTIIMHISADRSRIDFLSIPRDSRVRISDCKMFDGSVKRGWTTKFNAAFSLGGSNGNVAEAAACTMKTIQDLTGITFDHYAVVDFAGFENMINAVNGVPMCITEDIDSSKAKLHLKAGAQVLHGRTALAYSRARYGIGDGTDLMRIDRQHELMDNLAKKVLGMNLLTDAPQLTLLLKSAGESMTMDPDLGSFTYLVGLAFSLRNIDQDNINFATVPWKYPGDKSGDVVWTSDADVVFKRIKKDIPMDGGTTQSITSSTPDATAGSSSTSPSVSPSPERQTQKEILAECKVKG